MKGYRRKYKLNKQIHVTKSETRYKKEIKKLKNNHTALGFLHFPYNRMKSAERYDLAKSKSRESLAEYLFTHIVKHGVIIL